MDWLNLISTGCKHATVIAIAIMTVEVSASTAGTLKFRGDAYDLSTGKFVYSENHSEFYKEGKHAYSRVSYRDAAGKEFASKIITFLPNRTQPTYELRDVRDGYVEGIRREAGGTVYYARRKADEPMKEKRIQTPAPAVFDGGFDYFVRENFNEICAGTNKSFFFAVPIELDYFRFRVARQESGDFCRMNLELDNVLLRQIVRPIKLWYETKTGRLKKYEGISNINGPDGKSLKVRVVFTYPEK